MKTYTIVYKHEADIWRSLATGYITTAHSSNPTTGDLIYLMYHHARAGKTLAIKLTCYDKATSTEISRYSGKPNKKIPFIKGFTSPKWLDFTFKTIEGGLMSVKDRPDFYRKYNSEAA